MDSTENLLDNCDGIKLVAIAASISALLAENLNLEDQNIVASIFSAIGQNLSVIAAQNSKFQICVQACKDSKTNESQK
jgi:pantothenate kinase